MPTITLIIGPQKPVFCSENLPRLPGSRDDADELVDGPDRLLGVSALGGRRPFLGGEIMESSAAEAPLTAAERQARRRPKLRQQTGPPPVAPAPRLQPRPRRWAAAVA